MCFAQSGSTATIAQKAAVFKPILASAPDVQIVILQAEIGVSTGAKQRELCHLVATAAASEVVQNLETGVPGLELL